MGESHLNSALPKGASLAKLKLFEYFDIQESFK